MNKNELLRELLGTEIGLLKAKGGLLRAGVRDVSCYNNEIEKVEYAIAQVRMLDEPEKADEPKEMPENAAKIPDPEDYWNTVSALNVSVFNMCRILSDKCDREMDAMLDMDNCDRYNYDNINKLRNECRRFLTDWAIHNGAKND